MVQHVKMNTIKREVLLIALLFIGASIATPVEKVSRGLTFSSPFLVSGSLSVLPSQSHLNLTVSGHLLLV